MSLEISFREEYQVVDKKGKHLGTIKRNFEEGDGHWLFYDAKGKPKGKKYLTASGCKSSIVDKYLKAKKI